MTLLTAAVLRLHPVGAPQVQGGAEAVEVSSGFVSTPITITATENINTRILMDAGLQPPDWPKSPFQIGATSMKNISAALLAGLAFVACDRNTTGPLAPEQPALFPQTSAQDAVYASRAKLAEEEKAAHDRLLAHFPDQAKDFVERQLSDPNRQISLPNDEAADKLFATFYQKRAEHGRAEQITVVPATLALVDRLPSQGSVAVIVRRAGGGDTIILPESSASVESLGAAVTALYAVRARDGDVSPKNIRLTIENGVRPRHWNGDIDQRAAKTIAYAKSAARRNLLGVGEARTTQILMLGI